MTNRTNRTDGTDGTNRTDGTASDLCWIAMSHKSYSSYWSYYLSWRAAVPAAARMACPSCGGWGQPPSNNPKFRIGRKRVGRDLRARRTPSNLPLFASLAARPEVAPYPNAEFGIKREDKTYMTNGTYRTNRTNRTDGTASDLCWAAMSHKSYGSYSSYGSYLGTRALHIFLPPRPANQTWPRGIPPETINKERDT